MPISVVILNSVGKPGPGFEKVGFGFCFLKTRVPGSGFGFSKMYQIGDFWPENRQIGVFCSKK